ncbi:preprotein translocase subunit SecE [candidate division FCPU426 bacterium]|nr:preprotein translocase subunit SecE [candidate division FCPU426 bacterium]
MQKIIAFIREAYAELKRVTWPSRKEIMGSTLVVFVVVGILMLFIALFDFLLSMIVRMLV